MDRHTRTESGVEHETKESALTGVPPTDSKAEIIKCKYIYFKQKKKKKDRKEARFYQEKMGEVL